MHCRLPCRTAAVGRSGENHHRTHREEGRSSDCDIRKKPPLLIAVYGNVGGIKIQNQGFRRLLETVKKQLTEKLFNTLSIPGDFAVLVFAVFIQFMTEFQSVQGALSCNWSFIIPPAYILKYIEAVDH